MEKDPKGSNGILGGIALLMTGFFGGIAAWYIWGWEYGLIGIPVMIIGIFLQEYGHQKNEQM